MESKQDKTPPAFHISGNWESQAKKLKVTYPQLTDEDLKYEGAKQDELLSRIGTRLGKKREDVIEAIKAAGKTQS